MLMIRIALLLVLCSLLGIASAASDDSDAPIPTYMKGKEGWFWDQDREKPKEEQKAESNQKAAGPASAASQAKASPFDSQDLKDLQRFKDFQMELEQAQQIATINPSDRNMLRFLKYLAETRKKAVVFTDVGSRVAVVNPSVDDTVNGMNMRPTVPAATKAWDEQQRYQADARIRELAKTHGVFFFFRSDCPYCHAMAPVLKRFSARYGITIFPVSMDGPPLPEFPDAVRNNGIVARILESSGIPREEFSVPFVVMAKPSTQEMIPLGFGAMNDAQLVERIDLFAREAQRIQAQQGPMLAASTGNQEALQRANAAARRVRVPSLDR